MPGKIDAFLDSVSFFSYMAFVYLQKNKKILSTYGIEIEYHPVFLGAINAGSGNKPPWTLKAKAVYSKYDSERAKKHFELENVKTPDVFPIVTLLPQRCLIYIKESYPAKYEAAFGELFSAIWEQNSDISKPENLAKALQHLFAESEVQQIIEAASQARIKKTLQDETQKALDFGAFGAPWYQVTNKHGISEPFFGSDRFHFMWRFLELPYSDLAIIPNSKL